MLEDGIIKSMQGGLRLLTNLLNYDTKLQAFPIVGEAMRGALAPERSLI